MNILKYIGKRLITIFFSLIIIIIIAYVLSYAAPGNFFDIQRFQMGASTGISGSAVNQENIEILRRQFEKRYGIDQPLWKQIVLYMGRAATFKFGPSFYNPSTNIEDLIAEKFPVTLTMGLLAMALAIFLGIPLGILAALKRNTWVDYLSTFTAMIGQAIPAYVLGLLMVILFSIVLGWLPTGGWGKPQEMVLPIIALALAPMGTIMQFTRISLLDTLNQDYIRTAYAKGGTERGVIVKHGLRNSLIPIVTIIGPNLGYILAGSAVYIENQFRVPGIGQLFVQATGQRDYPLMITATFILALTIMFMNLIVDLVYAVLDPRIVLK